MKYRWTYFSITYMEHCCKRESTWNCLILGSNVNVYCLYTICHENQIMTYIFVTDQTKRSDPLSSLLCCSSIQSAEEPCPCNCLTGPAKQIYVSGGNHIFLFPTLGTWPPALAILFILKAIFSIRLSIQSAKMEYMLHSIHGYKENDI